MTNLQFPDAIMTFLQRDIGQLEAGFRDRITLVMRLTTLRHFLLGTQDVLIASEGQGVEIDPDGSETPPGFRRNAD